MCARAHVRVRVRVRACVRACVSLASDTAETIEDTIIKFGAMIASDMGFYHVLIKLSLTFIQGYTELNAENNECLIISKTIQAMPMTSAVKIAWLTDYNNDQCESDDLDLYSRSQVRLKHDYVFSLQYLGQHLWYYIQTWHDGRLMHGLERDHDLENVCKVCFVVFFKHKRKIRVALLVIKATAASNAELSCPQLYIYIYIFFFFFFFFFYQARLVIQENVYP